MTLRELRKKRSKLLKEFNKVDKLIKKRLPSVYFTCLRCETATQIKNLVYIQTHFYISPHGCMGGDYWRTGEAQILCSKCGHRNRLTRNSILRKKLDEKTIKKYESLKFYFGSIRDEFNE